MVRCLAMSLSPRRTFRSSPMFITRKEHDRIVAEKDREIECLRRDNKLGYLLESFEKRLDTCTADMSNCIQFANAHFGNATLTLPDEYPVYVPDHFGGKVIKQESTKVVILDEEGNATYAVTGKHSADKGYKYLLVRK